jgi:hypothetical protein
VSLEFIRSTFEAGGTRYLDVLSHHSYSCLSHPFEQMAKLAADTEALTEQFEVNVPVWHSEQGTGADGVSYIYLAETEEQCAVDLVQSYLSALGTGIEKFFWFSAQTSPTYGWGVFYEDYIPRPRLVALNGLARLLDGRRVTGRAELCDGQVACVLLDGDAGPAAAVWNLGEGLELRLPSVRGISPRDMLGNPRGGTDRAADTGPRPLLLEEGRPVYLVSTGPSAREVEDLLRRAEASPASGRFPLEAAARKTAGGGLEVRVTNLTGNGLDARVRIACPDLFAAPPEAVEIPDFPGHEVYLVSLTPDRSPHEGAEVEVSVTLEVGEHGIREDIRRLAVRF